MQTSFVIIFFRYQVLTEKDHFAKAEVHQSEDLVCQLQAMEAQVADLSLQVFRKRSVAKNDVEKSVELHVAELCEKSIAEETRASNVERRLQASEDQNKELESKVVQLNEFGRAKRYPAP